MKFINKVEIKYFRSFSDKVVKIEYLNDLNILSGGNDSGKSNVLRALNIFFKNEISHGIPFDFERDFSKLQLENSIKKYETKKSKNLEKEFRKSDQFIEIKCHFDLSEKPYGNVLPNKFWISRRWTRTKNWELNNNIETVYRKVNEKELLKLGKDTKQYTNKFNSLKQSITKFLNKIDYFYVPAIKDYYFFKELYSILQEKLTEISGKKIEESKQQLQETIKSETQKFFNKFKKSTKLDAGFLIEQKLLDFKKNIEVETGDDILLTSRGDGVQARLIPDILDELTDKHKYIIWGFEEPENSYEYKHSKILADEFYNKYSKDKQIFITTHSKEFLGISDPSGVKDKDKKVSIYRVFKGIRGGTKIEKYQEINGFSKKNIRQQFLGEIGDEKDLTKEQKTVLENIYDDLGIIDESKVISELEENINKINLDKQSLEDFKDKALIELEEKKKLKDENERLFLELEKNKDNNKTIIYCENKNAILLNKLGFNNLFFIGLNGKRSVFDSSKSKDGLFGIIDRDYMTDGEIEVIENNTNVRILDYYCFENYLFYPDNVEELFNKINKKFDKNKYIENIFNKINEVWGKDFTRDTMPIDRNNGYGNVIKYIEDLTKRKPDLSSIEYELNSNDFSLMYKYISMKKYKGSFNILNNIKEEDFIYTNWFKDKIKLHLKRMGIVIK